MSMSAPYANTVSFLFTPAESRRLVANGRDSREAIAQRGQVLDHKPVVRFVVRGTALTWLISEVDPRGRLAYGLAAFAGATPDLLYIEIDTLEAMARAAVYALEKDPTFTAAFGLDRYFAMARRGKSISADPEDAKARSLERGPGEDRRSAAGPIENRTEGQKP